MHFPFLTRARAHHPAMSSDETVRPVHSIESGFCMAICRFVLDCSCGAHHDTPYIDEALEWRELHQLLAPLADQLAP